MVVPLRIGVRRFESLPDELLAVLSRPGTFPDESEVGPITFHSVLALLVVLSEACSPSDSGPFWQLSLLFERLGPSLLWFVFTLPSGTANHRSKVIFISTLSDVVRVLKLVYHGCISLKNPPSYKNPPPPY